MRFAPQLAALACTGVALGAGLAWGVPTEPRTSRNAEFERLSQVHVVTYPGAGLAITGPDSYPVSYSPQWLAVAQQAERERMARWDLTAAPPPVGYDQPPPERDLAVEREGLGEVDVKRGPTDDGDQPEGDEPAFEEPPEG